MFLPKVISLSSCLIVLASSAAVKVPSGSTWPNIAPKSAYSRALGPPVSGMDTITVPYMPKSPLFPKFVDPKAMISKKTDLLSNLFGGLGPVYPMGLKPSMPYPMSAASLYGASDEYQPLIVSAKTAAEDGSGPYKRGIFGPFGGKPFGPMSPKFGGMSPFPDFGGVPDYSAKGDFSRKRRSTDDSSMKQLRAIMEDAKPETKDLGPPPPYPILTPIAEEPEDELNMLLKAMGDSTAPKQYLPGMFSPFGPMVDPSMFIAKKSAFLDTLFKNLATTTTTPSPTATDAPTTESTIVPPGFWLPSSIIPTPTEYTDKVGSFLDQLFESLKLNKTAAAGGATADLKSNFARSIKTGEDAAQSKIARSIDDLSSISAAKDTIVDSIMTELGDLKGSMVTTMNDLIAYEKSASPAAASAKKPFKPFAPGMWPKPAADGTLPFQQKMAILSQVFDMLTDLQKNITVAVQNAMKAKLASGGSSEEPTSANNPFMANDVSSASSSMPMSMSFLDAIKSKLGTLNYEMPPSYAADPYKFGPKVARTLPKSPASFWVAYPDSSLGTEKREAKDNLAPIAEEDSPKGQPQARGVKMQMHQGYQSLPAGSIESVQAGGGSTPGHQGGGIKLLDTSDYEDMNNWANWMGYQRNDYQGRRHHNHH